MDMSPTTSSPTYEVNSPTLNVSSPTPLNYRIQGHFCPYTHQTHINYSSRRSFIHCGAKRKSILDIGHISVGELTFDVGESTSYVGELVVGELTRWRNDRYAKNLKVSEMNFSLQTNCVGDATKRKRAFILNT